MTEREHLLNQLKAVEQRITEVEDNDPSSYKRLYTLHILRRNLYDQLNHYGEFNANERRLVSSSRTKVIKGWKL